MSDKPVEVERTAKFGWCLTNQHAGTKEPGCPGKNGTVECACKCHKGQKEGQKKTRVKRKS